MGSDNNEKLAETKGFAVPSTTASVGSTASKSTDEPTSSADSAAGSTANDSDAVSPGHNTNITTRVDAGDSIAPTQISPTEHDASAPKSRPVEEFASAEKNGRNDTLEAEGNQSARQQLSEHEAEQILASEINFEAHEDSSLSSEHATSEEKHSGTVESSAPHSSEKEAITQSLESSDAESFDSSDAEDSMHTRELTPADEKEDTPLASSAAEGAPPQDTAQQTAVESGEPSHGAPTNDTEATVSPPSEARGTIATQNSPAPHSASSASDDSSTEARDSSSSGGSTASDSRQLDTALAPNEQQKQQLDDKNDSSSGAGASKFIEAPLVEGSSEASASDSYFEDDEEFLRGDDVILEQKSNYAIVEQLENVLSWEIENFYGDDGLPKKKRELRDDPPIFLVKNSAGANVEIVLTKELSGQLSELFSNVYRAYFGVLPKDKKTKDPLSQENITSTIDSIKQHVANNKYKYLLAVVLLVIVFVGPLIA